MRHSTLCMHLTQSIPCPCSYSTKFDQPCCKKCHQPHIQGVQCTLFRTCVTIDAFYDSIQNPQQRTAKDDILLVKYFFTRGPYIQHIVPTFHTVLVMNTSSYSHSSPPVCSLRSIIRMGSSFPVCLQNGLHSQYILKCLTPLPQSKFVIPGTHFLGVGASGSAFCRRFHHRHSLPRSPTHPGYSDSSRF